MKRAAPGTPIVPTARKPIGDGGYIVRGMNSVLQLGRVRAFRFVVTNPRNTIIYR